MSRKQKRMGPVGCFGQIENIKRQSLAYNQTQDKEAYDDAVRFLCSDSGYSLMEKTPTGQLQ